jgi:hypothetical protein
MADQIKGVPAGLVEEPLDSNQIKGVPSGLVAEPANQPAPVQQGDDRIANSLQNATISPPESGFAATIDRFRNKVRDLMGADRPAGDFVGGVVLGPLNAAHGAAIIPSHPARGTHEVLSGIGQTVALPAAVVNPGTMAYAAPGIIAQQGVSTGLKSMGVDDDYSNLAGDAAAIVTGVGANSPKVVESVKALAKPPLKMALEAAKDIPVIRGAIKGANAFKDVAPALRDIWAKPAAEDPYSDVQIVEPSPAPYRMSGRQIQDAVTVTPRAPFVPKGLLNAAPDDVPAQPVTSPEMPAPKPLKATTPKTAQTEVLKNLGIAAPAATIKPMTKVPTAAIVPRDDLSFAGSRSGDSAAMNQLTENFSPDRLGINDLRGIAQARGIKVAPTDNHQILINKIHDSMTDYELDRFEQAAKERMQPDYSLPSVSSQ